MMSIRNLDPWVGAREKLSRSATPRSPKPGIRTVWLEVVSCGLCRQRRPIKPHTVDDINPALPIRRKKRSLGSLR